MEITGKEGILHLTGKEIQNVFQNLFKQRGKWRRKAAEIMPYYTQDAPHAMNKEKWIVCTFDGHTQHGGLTDRFRGMVSTWFLCKKMGYTFKIYFEHPFTLTDYVIPNKVDWQMVKADISYNAADALPIYCGTNGTHVERPFQRLYFSQKFKMNYKQIHVFTNAYLKHGKEYGVYFKELFKPTPKLQQLIQFNTEAMKDNYCAMTFRFQQLLGDFSEGEKNAYDILPEEERELLITRCINKADEVFRESQFKGKLLVTSDSAVFLERISKALPYVYTIPGKVVHMDYTFTASDDSYMKSFVDLYMISNAKKVWLLQTGEMYNSGFPRRASEINNVPFERIKF